MMSGIAQDIPCGLPTKDGTPCPKPGTNVNVRLGRITCAEHTI